MLINSEKQLLSFVKYSPIIIILSIAIIVNSLIYYQNDKNYKKNLLLYEKNYIETNKALVKAQVEKVYNDIMIEKLDLEDELKENLRERGHRAYQIIEGIHKNFINEGEEKVLSIIKESLRNVRFNDGMGYFYINDIKGNSILHPTNPHLENTNVLNIKDKVGTSIIQDVIKNIKQTPEYFNTYFWNKPNEKDKVYEKITFNKIYEPLNLIISTGEYIDIFKEKLKKHMIYDHIQKSTYGKNGYIFVFDYDGFQLAHIKKSYIGQNRINLTDANGTKITQTIIDKAKKGSGFVTYIGTIMPQTGKPAEKITFVKGLDEWGWAIASGFYNKELLENLSFKAKELKRVNKNALTKTLIISLVLTVFLLILALYISKVLKNFFDNYNNQIQKEIIENRNKDIILHQQSKMASMGEMIGNIAHQWRQPLNLISTAASRIKLEEALGTLTKEKQEESISAILKSTDYLSKTIDDFREFFNPNKLLLDISTKTLFEKTFQLISARFKNKDIDIKTDIADFNMITYENELIQSLINILNNSIDALEEKDIENKVVFFSIEKITDCKLNKCKLEGCNNSCVKITIKDNAGGIKESNLSKIFDAYFTTKHQSQGTGIGLYMTYQIILKHLSGHIEVKNDIFTYENKEYKGAEFTIMLPFPN